MSKTYTINVDAMAVSYQAGDNAVKMYTSEVTSNGGLVRSNGNAREYNKVQYAPLCQLAN